KAVRFIVNVITPVIGFQEIAFSLKTRHPEKEVSIHLVYIDDDYISLLQPWRRWAETAGLQLSDEPPPPKREGELYISVPSLVAHPLVERLEVDPATFETQYSRMYLIGDSSLIKLNLPPIGWGALWQAATLAKAIAGEISGGVFEITAETWDVTAGKDKFYQWLTHRMTSGTPLAHLRGLYDLWKNHVIKSLKSPI
ncbi:MAG: NAD(P)/FAD-dependent oxidoreductase, partial [Pyrobaculum sp.]